MLGTYKSLVIFKPFLVSIYHLFLSILLYVENNWMPFQICRKFALWILRYLGAVVIIWWGKKVI